MAKKETGGGGGAKPSSKASTPNQLIFKATMMGLAVYAFVYICYWAYKIRMQAIEEYGLVIHEFDPYFNYRATEYLYAHGAKAFFEWFDYMVWYPLGRPVGSTIYPGMQFTAVWIKRYIMGNMSINDVCCLIPAWFGAIATTFVGMIAYECAMPANSSSNLFRFVMDIVNGKQTLEKGMSRPLFFGFTTPALECALCAMGMMAVVPAHLMRSVGGGYDNESIAMTAMNATFFFWIRALRRGDDLSWLWGIPAGIAYFYMVAAWGGYIFVLNMVGVHAAVLVALGRFSDKVWKAYSLFYVIGTALAIQVPVVGWAPLKSLEQLAPCAVFFGYQILQFCEYVKRKQKLTRPQVWKLRVQVSLIAAALAVAVAVTILPRGYLGPLSSRVRGLFVAHTKTGNPLVDSVAEHQAASSQAYFQYLHHVCSLAPIGYIMVMFNLSESSSFLVAWGTATYFFSHKMVRLILLTAPVGSALGGIAAGRIFAWCIRQLWEGAGEVEVPKSPEAPDVSAVNGNGTTANKNGDAPPKGKKKKKKANAMSQKSSSSFDGFKVLLDAMETASKSTEGIIVKRTLAVVVLIIFWMLGTNFKSYCWRLSADLSHPSIIMKARTRDGRIVKVDDYREAYWWVRDNTPEDARIMAWWDYGYQITAIANRTTLADGNTWNHEHIALLGKALTTDLEEGWEIARNLADYVLVWAGGGGDDLAKSPHLARIANSVYRDHCPDDPTCGQFGFIDRQGTPSPMMQRSLLYQLHGHRVKPNVEVSEDRFVEVFRSKYSKVRVYKISGVSKESKEWVREPANRLCDVPGSWFCPGQYPPTLQKILAQKKDFAQLEDFNRGDSDEEYQKQYFENLNKPKKNSYHANINHAQSTQQRKPVQQQKSKRIEIGADGSIVSDERSETERTGQSQRPLPPKEELDKIRSNWADTDTTTALWNLINEGKVDSLKVWLKEEPEVAYVRSSDGRGPMFWAYEARNTEITKLLMKFGVPTTDRDKSGKTPEDLVST